MIQPNFHITEHFLYTENWIRCRCCNRLLITDLLFSHMAKLEEMRQQLGFRFIIDSGYRCPDHNREVGGAPNSMHLRFATDVRPVLTEEGGLKVFKEQLKLIKQAADDFGFQGIGYYDNFTHLDLRKTPARWEG